MHKPSNLTRTRAHLPVYLHQISATLTDSGPSHIGPVPPRRPGHPWKRTRNGHRAAGGLQFLPIRLAEPEAQRPRCRRSNPAERQAIFLSRPTTTAARRSDQTKSLGYARHSGKRSSTSVLVLEARAAQHLCHLDPCRLLFFLLLLCAKPDGKTLLNHQAISDTLIIRRPDGVELAILNGLVSHN